SLSALVLRFRDRTATESLESWTSFMRASARDLKRQVSDEEGTRALLAFLDALVALVEGGDPARCCARVPPPFDTLLQQVLELAAAPVWQHPGNFPIEFLVERAAQRAVRGLRVSDEHRAMRLANLALRFDLMALDLRQQEELMPLARFLETLG